MQQFIHDGDVNQFQQKSLEDLKAFINNDYHISCHPSPIRWTEIWVSTDTIATDSERLGKGDTTGWIIAITNCQLADSVELILNSSSTKPILRLDSTSCPATTGLTTDRLKEVNRDGCVRCSVTKWLEQQICFSSTDNDTRRLLLGNATHFNLSKEFQDCSESDDIRWSPTNSPLLFDASENGSRLNGRKLRLTSLERFQGERRSTYVTVERDVNGNIIGYKGYCYEIIHALQKLYNFTYEVEIPGDNTYGRETLNGSWNGMIGLILENRADIAVGVFSVTHSRSQVVDFSVGFLEEPATILIPPPAQESRLLVYAKPFQLQVWVTLMVFASVLPAFLWYFLKSLWIHHQGKYPSLGENYAFVLRVLIGQSGQGLPPVGFSPRFLGIVWCASAVVFASAYVGVLVSFLRFPKLSPIISNLEELPRSQLKWAVVRGTALESLFIEATSGVYKAIGDGLLAHPEDRIFSGTDGIQRVISGSYGYIEERSYLKAITEQDHAKTGKCRFSFVNQEFFKVNFAFAFPKASPLKPLFDKKILQMMEAGLGEYWKNLYCPSSGAAECGIVKQSDGAKSLTLVDLQGAFLILAIGSGLAFLLFLAENFTSLSPSVCV